CYRGIEISARIQRVLLSIEVVMLLVFGLVALVRVLTGNAPPGHVTPSFSWFNPGAVPFSALVSGLILMLFIYWGWDTSVSVNEAIPDSFAKMHPRYFTPTVATLAMGGVSAVMYAAMNYISGGDVIADAVTAIGVWIAFYYGLTGF